MRPSSISRLTSCRLGRNRRLHATSTASPFAAASAASSAVPSSVWASGFSTSTWRPRATAARAWARWRSVGEHTSTASARESSAAVSSPVTSAPSPAIAAASARRPESGSKTAAIVWPSARTLRRWRSPTEPAPTMTKRMRRLDVRPAGAAHGLAAQLRLTGVGMAHGVLAAELGDRPPRQLDDLRVGQLAEIRAHLFPLLAQAQEVLLDHVLVGGPRLPGDGFADEPLVHGELPERRAGVRGGEEEHLGPQADLAAEIDGLA